MRYTLLVLLLLSLAVPAAAQSTRETFTTAYNSALNVFLHETVYEFDIIDVEDASSQQAYAPTELLIDVYYNTKRIFLANLLLQCLSVSDGETWYTIGYTNSFNYMASMRSTAFAERCRIRYVFINFGDERYRDNPQRGSVRLNVSSTTGGWMRLTKADGLIMETPDSDSMAANLREGIAVAQAAQAAEQWEWDR